MPVPTAESKRAETNWGSILVNETASTDAWYPMPCHLIPFRGVSVNASACPFQSTHENEIFTPKWELKVECRVLNPYKEYRLLRYKEEITWFYNLLSFIIVVVLSLLLSILLTYFLSKLSWLLLLLSYYNIVHYNLYYHYFPSAHRHLSSELQYCHIFIKKNIYFPSPLFVIINELHIFFFTTTNITSCDYIHD